MSARRLAGCVILAICLGAPLLEGLDRWDDTRHGGPDTEVNLVAVALAAGLAVSVVAAVLRSIRLLLSWCRSTQVRFELTSGVPVVGTLRVIPCPSPPVELRI